VRIVLLFALLFEFSFAYFKILQEINLDKAFNIKGFHELSDLAYNKKEKSFI